VTLPSIPASVAPLLPKWEVEAGENSDSDILERVDDEREFLSIVAARLRVCNTMKLMMDLRRVC